MTTSPDPYRFRAEDPFPLFELARAQSQYAKFHAEACDAKLGFRLASCEARFAERLRKHPTALRPDLEDWKHLAPRVYLTTYLELRAILHELAPLPGQTLVDLGCGYARIPFVLARHHAGVHFAGYEAVAERVEESRRVLDLNGLTDARVECADLLDPALEFPLGDCYFAYDIGGQADVDSILQRFAREIIPRGPVRIAVRGERMRQGLSRLRESLVGGKARELGLTVELFKF